MKTLVYVTLCTLLLVASCNKSYSELYVELPVSIFNKCKIIVAWPVKLINDTCEARDNDCPDPVNVIVCD